MKRDITQIEQFSRRLRGKTARGDPTAEVLDASRLFAHEGLDPRRLNQALQTFELRPTYEEVFRADTTSVGDHLAQVHETIAATAVQEARRNTVAAFEGHMNAYRESAWAREKRALLDPVEPFSLAATGAMSSSVPFAHSGPVSTTPGGGSAASGIILRGRVAKYADIVRKMNASVVSGRRYEAVGDFAAACADDITAAGGGDRRTTMLRVWQVLQRQLEGVYNLPGQGAPARAQREAALITGGRHYLEENFIAFMQNVVATHRTVAALGGNPSRIGLVHAYLRVREKERGLLDFDQPGGVDTFWLRIFTCMRAGFTTEAVAVALGTAGHDAATPRAAAGAGAPGRDVGLALQEWADGGCRPLSGDAASGALAEAERLLRDKLARGREPHFPHRVMIYALLSGSNRSADAVLRESPSYFPTIEDFLWLKLGLVRQSISLSDGPLGSQRAVAVGMESFSLEALQHYLRQYPPSHYSHGGREPLLYVIVLLLSLQWAMAVAFLARDPSTRDYRIDAVHVGICLWHAGVIGASKPSSLTAGDADATVGALAHQYGRSLLHGDLSVALEYYMLAATTQGGSAAVRGSLLRELLTEGKAYGALLGAGGAAGEGGPLAAFVPDPEERRRVLEAVAAECAAAAQLEEAVELYMSAGRPRHALAILNQRLSELLEPAAGEAGKNEEADALASRASAAAAVLETSRDPEDLREVHALAQLKGVKAMLVASVRNDSPGVLRALTELSFVPTERYRVGVAATAVAGLHPAVADRLQAILLAAATALSAASKWDELQAIVAFAAAVPNRISQAAFQRLNQLQAAVAS